MSYVSQNNKSCPQCNLVFPVTANFCLQCGGALTVATLSECSRLCTIVLRQEEYKWSLFGKERCYFEAITADGELIGTSSSFVMTGFEIYGPNERNQKHKAAFDSLVNKLIAKGWSETTDSSQHWYDKSFSQTMS